LAPWGNGCCFEGDLIIYYQPHPRLFLRIHALIVYDQVVWTKVTPGGKVTPVYGTASDLEDDVRSKIYKYLFVLDE